MKKTITNSKFVKAIVLLVALLMVTGCASATKNAYRTIGAAGVTYDESMKAFAEMYNKGYISEAEKAMALNIGNKYYDTYQLAVTTLEAYDQLDGYAREQKQLELNEILLTLTDMGSRVMNLVKEFQSRIPPTETK